MGEQKIILLLVLLTVSIFIISCARQASDKNTFAALEQLSDEDLAAALASNTESSTDRSSSLPSDITGALAALTWESCSDSDSRTSSYGQNTTLKGTVRVNYAKHGFKKFMTYTDACINSTHLREYFCKEKGAGYGRMTVSCPSLQKNRCLAGACSG